MAGLASCITPLILSLLDYFEENLRHHILLVPIFLILEKCNIIIFTDIRDPCAIDFFCVKQGTF